MSHVVALVTSSPALRKVSSKRALPKTCGLGSLALWISTLAAEADWVRHMRNDKPAARRGQRAVCTPISSCQTRAFLTHAPDDWHRDDLLSQLHLLAEEICGKALQNASNVIAVNGPLGIAASEGCSSGDRKWTKLLRNTNNTPGRS